MGISNKSQGKKSDKETQSPVLKLFRDMMQKEKQDPEKTNLLKNKTKEEKKKKKHYSKTAVSNCSERRDPPFKGNQELRKAEYARTQHIPFHEEKRESWWFWGEPKNEKPASEDTCSCVSCALKKLINTDYACMGCLVLIFIISVIVAFLLVYKSIPCLNDKSESEKADNGRPKRKIDALSRLRLDHLGKKSLGGSKWGRDVGSYEVPYSMDSESSSHDLNHLDSDSELFKIFHGDVMREIQSSDRLKEFYNKLIQTDARIRKLKKSDEFALTSLDNIEDKYKTYPERAKRSLKIFHKPLQYLHFRKNKKDKVNVMNKINNEKNRNIEDIKVPIAANKDTKPKNLNKTRYKKYVNVTEPEGFVIENKRVLIQYKPKYINRKSKCSHAPKESKSHENQLKHPFYQNSQRLDELLDKFLDKNLPDIVTDEFGIDMVFGKEKKCKHPKVETEIKESPDKILIKNDKTVTNSNEKLNNNNNFKTNDNDLTKILKSETSTIKNDIFDNLEFDGNKKRDGSTANAYGLLMSVTTIMYAGNNNLKRTTYSPLIDRVPNARKLLQTDTDDDMNEVMVNSAHDEPNKEDRKKRMDDLSSKVINNKLNANPASILNPNWKGPMPLYPDELNSMIKQEPIIVNRVETPVHRYNSETVKEPVVKSIERRKFAPESDEKLVNGVETVNSGDSLLKSDEFETDLNDMEYIEDYFRNKYDRLVGLAQAYSDYGVLVDKKTNDEKVVDKAKLVVPDHSSKLSLSGIKKGFKNSIFGRPKKGSLVSGIPSEGFRLEIQPTSASREDNPAELYKKLQKHIRVSNFKQTPFTKSNIDTEEIDLIYRPISEELTTENNGIIFAIGKGTRSLKSIELIDDDTLSEVPGDDGAIDSKRNIKNVFDSEHKKHKFEVGNFFTEDNVNNSAMELTTLGEFAKNGTNNVKIVEGVFSNIADRSLSDIFMLLANWFSALDGVDVSVNQSLVQNSSFPDKTKPREFNKNKTLEIINPLHTSDMAENVGHRSRVLLSTEDVNDTLKVEHKGGNEELAKVNEDVDLKIMNITKLPVKTTENRTKSVVKRNADDSNLIFWNDLYDDDEYGVQDHLENNVRHTHSVGNDFLKKPNDWFRDKVRKIADGFHKRGNSLKEHKDGEAFKSVKAMSHNENVVMKSKHKNNVYKRMLRDVKDNGVPKKTDFSALAANMKKICRKAANDIAQANKVDARAVSKEGQATTTLMQQLMRLMSELVEYQVKQRTCRKLPPDLEEYLKWLTSPNPDPDSAAHSAGYQTEEYPEIDFGKISDKLEDHTLDIASSERDERSDRVDTLQSVQDLMQHYEDLTDDDKIKMTGVKEYLENQRQYLQKRMSPVYDLGIDNTDGLRFRRDITSASPQTKHKRRKRKFKHIINNFINKFIRKHDTNYNNNNNNKTNAVVKEVMKLNSNNKKAEDTGTVKDKRNLRDVYYKADAKKLTTIKSHVK